MSLMFAAISLVPLAFLPETYGPTILKGRASRMREESVNSAIFAPIELQAKGAKQLLTVVLLRPLRMIISEAIVLFTCLYLSLVYAIFYIFLGPIHSYSRAFTDLMRERPGSHSSQYFWDPLSLLVYSFIMMVFFSVLRRPTNRGHPLKNIAVYRSLASRDRSL